MTLLIIPAITHTSDLQERRHVLHRKEPHENGTDFGKFKI